ncbi:MAG TPA: TlyA family RNA methyltransferase [Anaerolineaceae bacterium]
MGRMQEKVRLDVLLTERGLVESRSLAQRMVMAGQVRVAGQVVLKPAVKVPVDAEVTVEHGPKFVSRGGEKLEAALQAFGLTDLTSRVCADIGASTGGFTDCLLQAGAEKVYSIDVGYGELHWKLRNDPRVVVMERTNARFVEKLPEPVSLVVIDASFISLKIFFPVIRAWFGDAPGQVVMLIKPQFEAGRSDVSRGDGVIRDARIHHQVLTGVLEAANAAGYSLAGLIRSPLLGPKGNTEFLAHLRYPGETSEQEMTALINAVLPDAGPE